jgi:hypothetical protein
MRWFGKLRIWRSLPAGGMLGPDEAMRRLGASVQLAPH